MVGDVALGPRMELPMRIWWSLGKPVTWEIAHDRAEKCGQACGLVAFQGHCFTRGRSPCRPASRSSPALVSVLTFQPLG
jgi:hypothetical protein